MAPTLELQSILGFFREQWQSLPEHRQANNNMKYSLAEAALSALSVFFMQSPSFLAHQRALKKRKGRENVQTLFQVARLPSDNQLRNLLDGVAPSHFQAAYAWVHAELERTGQRQAFRGWADTYLLALDGVTYFASTRLSCPQCLTRHDSQGTKHYSHSAISPVLVKPGTSQVLPLPPEFITPQDGQDKQDCERAAAQRWLAQHHALFAPQRVTVLGDDLYANHPFCDRVANHYHQFFVCVAKPDSHTHLYSWISMLEKTSGLAQRQRRVWTGQWAEQWHYRWTTEVPLRASPDSLHVGWLELTITREDSGAVLYRNSWVTNHDLTEATVEAIAQVGRARWKVENESHNILKNHGYHLEHNFGHGRQHLAMVLFTLNVLAFLLHTVQELVSAPYRFLRQTLVTRYTFFDDLRALTRYFVFDSWHALWRFMLQELEVVIPPGLFVPD
jgi:hypothetical protein